MIVLFFIFIVVQYSSSNLSRYTLIVNKCEIYRPCWCIKYSKVLMLSYFYPIFYLLIFLISNNFFALILHKNTPAVIIEISSSVLSLGRRKYIEPIPTTTHPLRTPQPP